MDCKHARMLLEVAHPLATELEANETEALAAHLADCPDCGPWAEAEHRIDEKVGVAMRDVAIPDGLQQRIVRRLGVERDAWWRARVIRVAGAAAAVLLICWAAYTFWWSKKPGPDWNQFVYEVNLVVASPDQVEQAFADRDVSMRAPRKIVTSSGTYELEYRYLESISMTDFQGKRVPLLQFFFTGSGNQRPAIAKVYVLSDRQFNLSDRTKPQAGSRQDIDFFSDPEDPHVLYVMVWTQGVDLRKTFFKEQSRPNG